MKKILSIITLVALSIGLLGSCKKTDSTVSVTNVALDRTTLTLTVGDDDVKLVATVTPDNATDKSVNWASDRPEVAIVDNQGNVHAVAEGSATISVTTTDGGKKATCAVTVKAAFPAGALAGEFTVDASGKKVHFSQGNLYADGDKALHFEANQYSSASSWDASHVSLFTWSSTVETAVGDTNSGDFLFCDESHKVSVDGSEAIYYALSKDEWTYLINNNGDETIRKGKFKYAVTVCEKTNCLILAPDDFTGTIEASYDATAWATAEADGLVCLPAAGLRNLYNIYYFGDWGYCWSSSANGNSAYRVLFNSREVITDSIDSRVGGFSVRLVTDAK